MSNFEKVLFQEAFRKYKDLKKAKICTISEQEGLCVAYHTLYMLILRLNLEQEYARYKIAKERS